ncbi:hypothetical protein GGR58DRAFT_479571 [Xylaria digitata]|nr:hypothetical protein GGR58DRAFT_479571 [Xylaria digitata]
MKGRPDKMPRTLELINTAFASAQPNTPNSKGKKRSPADDGFRPKKLKKSNGFERIDPNVCGNCGESSHKAAFCVKTSRSGWMEACPKCDSTKHIYELCPQRKKGPEDFAYLILNRGRRPPVKSMMMLGNVIRAELGRIGSPWCSSMVLDLPYSSKYARQEALQNHPKSHTPVGYFTREAKGRIAEPGRSKVTLADAHRNHPVAKQSWSKKEEEFGLEQDSPVLDQRRVQEHPSYAADLHDHNITYAPCHTPRRPRLYSSGAESTATIQESGLPSPCENCAQLSHLTRECQHKCAACGEDNHIIKECSLRSEACLCAQIPGHRLKDCDQYCNYCLFVENNYEPHSVNECPAICHYCLKKGHNMTDCTKAMPDRKCCAPCLEKGDGEKHHLPFQCIQNWCPDEECKNPLSCVSHCKGCGWNIDDIEVDTHECQFYKVWGGMSEIGGPTIELQCRNVKDHQLKHRELVAIRAAVLMEVDAMVAATRGPIEKWPIECPECRRTTTDISRE